MSDSLVSRIVDFVENGAIGSPFSIEDFDEMKILHNRAYKSFPREFNDLFSRLDSSDSSNYKTEMFRRLNRILHVVNGLPVHLQAFPGEVAETSEALTPTFELKKADKDRIFALCIDMRKIVFSTIEFDEPHRRRLLNRIAAIEAETHKPKGLFDVVRGGINDLGETLGKFGKDIKPLTDRMAEVTKIARSGSKEYEQLPPPEDIKRLPPPADEDE